MSSEPLRRDPPAPEAIERRTRQIGRELFAYVERGASIGDAAWWDAALMDLTMSDPLVKVQLFRFIDALPSLNGDAAIRRELDDFLAEANGRLPLALKAPLVLTPQGALGDRLLAGLSRLAATRMAHRFIAGSTPEEVERTVKRLRRGRRAITADLLGEAVITEAEADAYQRGCLELLQRLGPTLNELPEVPQIDRDDRGPIPRMNLSLKLTSLVPRFDALHAGTTQAEVLARLRPILREARRLGAFINIDMEQYAHKDLTHAIFTSVLDEPEFRDWPDAGIVVQAYLKDAPQDIERLRDWAARRGTPITVRLVKGAYWDYEVLHARHWGWPVPVFEQKWATDASYERCADQLLRDFTLLRPAFAGHNIRSLAHALAAAEARRVPPGAIEMQVLYGMGEGLERAFVDRGLRVRVYAPFGAMLPGMAYLVRRLLENTSNESFLKASAAGADLFELLRNPEETAAMWRASRPALMESPSPGAWPPFRNEPPTDFSREENRDALRKAIESVREQLAAGPRLVYPIIDGQGGPRPGAQDNHAPGDRSLTVSRASWATVEEASRAVEAARRAAGDWSSRPAVERAEILRRAADLMRRRRFELAAWEIFECGKPWREADADVAEAIDFCEFYAREMVRIGRPVHRDVPGETNAIEHIARGVAVVIPPWNFPLAIPCGMTAAALVTGNTVILKPAEQSPVIAWHLFQVLRAAGVPDGALHYLPGIGEEVGPTLVNHPEVDLIAFTGSRAVGLLVNRQAAETPPGQDHVKRVIAEMGGKNAIIVAEDADLDEAVLGVLTSAFGYAGQKCSACSRVIVPGSIHDGFLARLVEAAKTLPVGPPEDPNTVVGPLIDEAARRRVLEYAALAPNEGRVVLRVDPGDWAGRGHYVGPMIVDGVSPRSRLAQEEIFGPILTVIPVASLDEALDVANGTSYALTGGLYARNPSVIARVRREFRVGNLYINRPITGALVDRQPFGGFRLSGIGTKAGGTDYLREFLLTRVITENTMRRGFAPEDLAEPEPARLTADVGI
jgi:RHH-type proline utilization regulon transcriptional repressor/proline dehydrogenase/delta 1-pyrroline-5-carboxylate dehydrogenase